MARGVWSVTEPDRTTNENELVSITLEGYKFLSLSFSVKDVVPSPGLSARVSWTVGRDATLSDGEGLAAPGESGAPRWLTRLSTFEWKQPATLGQITSADSVEGSTYLGLKCLLRGLEGLELD